MRHANAPVTEHDRHLVVDAPEGRSHQAMLALGALPEELEFPARRSCCSRRSRRWTSPSTRSCTRAGRHREAISRVRRRIVDADVAYGEQLDVRARAVVVRGGREPAARARELDAYLQSHERPPLLNCAISLAVGAGERAGVAASSC